MDCYNIVVLYFNYEEFINENISSFSIKTLLKEIKILLIRSNRLLVSYKLPIINFTAKQISKQILVEQIEKSIGANIQGIWKITELYVYNNNNERINLKRNNSVEIIFVKSDEIKSRIQSSGLIIEFVPIFEINKLNINDHSKDIVFYISKWIEKECMNRTSLQKWFNSAFNKEIVLIGPDYSIEYLSKDIKQKSISLDTINTQLPRPQSANIELFNKKQADSLDQLSQKVDKKMIANPSAFKMALKSKISKTKSTSVIGPIAAMPLSESVHEPLIVNNLLLNRQINYQPESDIVVHNPFWGKRKPDLNQILNKAKSFILNDNVYRTRFWHIVYPLHFAAYKGDVLHVTSLIEKGYRCTEKDYVGWTAFHYAVWYNHKDVVVLFIKSNVVSVNIRTDDSLTGLHIAIYKGNSDISEILLKQPDINISLQTLTGEDARSLSDRLKQFSINNLLKSAVQKTTKLPVYLVDNSIKHVILSQGMETTFQHLKMQMIDILNIPSNCVDIFSFWIVYKLPKITGKYCISPLECFGDFNTTLKDLNLEDFKVYWKRNILLSLNSEMKVKNPTALSLLFDEAVQNFTIKSFYPCDSRDVILLSSVLLYLHLPLNIDKLTKANRGTLSFSRTRRPLSSLFSSNPDVSSQDLSLSLHTLKDLSLPRSTTDAGTSLYKSSIMDLRKRQAKQFLANAKNLSLISPKRSKNLKINLAEDILNQFMSSSFAYKFYSVHDIKFRFLTLCWNLTLYGCAYFDVEIKLQPSIPFISCILAVNDMGVYIIHSKTKTLIQSCKYSSIRWNNNLETKILILFSKKNNIYIKSKNNTMITQLMLKLQAMNSI